ncbi:MAG: Mu-like prophage major head subunit gpT family protein [Planctomycetota bacterium]|nr:Mu-like prophage major head subunit gpT family protein [Planctomycetota bacterium]
MGEQLLLTASVEIKAADVADRPARVSILAYNGEVMTIPGFGTVVIDLAGLDITAACQLLADHDNNLAGVLGSGVATVINGQLHVDGTLSRSSEAAMKIIGLSKDGVGFQASVGVVPTERERIAPNKTIFVNGRSVSDPRGFLLVKRGTLREVSLVPLGCDPSTSVAIAASLKGKIMPTTTLPEVSMLPEDAEGLTDVERIQARWTRESWHDPAGGPRHRARTAFMSAASGKITYEDFERELLKAKLADAELQVLKASMPKGPAIQSSQRQATGDVLEGMILAHLGAEQVGVRALGAETMQRARDMRVTNMLDLLRASLTMDGRDVPHDQTELIRASASIVSLPTALGNAAGKIAMDAYRQAVPTWRSFAAIKPASNFKAHCGVRLTDIRSLEQIQPDGTFQHGSLEEAVYDYKIDTYGKILTLTRQDIINDDLGLFNDTAQGFGKGAVRKLSDLVYGVLLANGGAFFAAGNANYFDGVGTALSATSLATALQKMRGQTDADGAVLDIVPKTLLTPPELEQTAKALLQSDFIQRTATDNGPTGNTLKNALALEVESRLSNATFTGNSAKAWYLFAAPIDAAVIVAFLNGMESPTVQFFGLDADVNALRVSWRVFHDFGAALADPKAACKAKGEA